METKNDCRNRTAGGQANSSGEDVFVFPATSAQRRFWLVDQLMPDGNRALNVPLASQMTGRLNVPQLQAAINEVVRRHEILRTSLKAMDEGIFQLIHPHKTVPLQVCDCTHWRTEEREALLHAAMHEEADLRMVLTEAPWLRAKLLKLSETEHVLLLTTHHVACDGWSQGILCQEVFGAYAALGAGKTQPELPLQYADFAQWQEDWLQSEEAKDQGDYWKGKLQGTLPWVNLPTDRPRRPGRSFPGELYSILVNKDLAERIKALCLKENLTPAMVYLGAFGLLLRRYSGHQEIITGSTAANRGQTELEELIGFFANPLLLRLDLSGNPTLRQLFRRIRDLSLEAFANQGYPFENVVANVETAPQPDALQWLQMYFVYQKTFLLPQELPGLRVVPLHSVSCGALFEWTLVVLESEEGIRLQVEFDSHLFEKSSMVRALDHYQQLLSNFLLGTERRLDEIDKQTADIVWRPSLPQGVGAPESALEGPRSTAGRGSREATSKTASREAGPPAFSAPLLRTPTERVLGEIWKELLGLDQVGPTDNFFDRGGKSLASLRLLNQVQARTGCSLSLVHLFQHPTLESLATLIDRRAGNSSPAAPVPIHASGSLPPFFCLTGTNRTASEVQSLIERLGEDQPIYMIPVDASDAGSESGERIGGLAEAALKNIRAIQTQGPYYLGGDLGGGVVAYEAARQLTAVGETVGILVMFNVSAPASRRMEPDPGSTSVQESSPNPAAVKAEISENSPSRKAARSSAPASPAPKPKGFYSKILSLLQKDAADEGTARSDKSPKSKPAAQSGDRWESNPYNGRLILVRAANDPRNTGADLTNGWGNCVSGGVDVIEVPGTAASLAQESVALMVASKLVNYLRAAQVKLASGSLSKQRATS